MKRLLIATGAVFGVSLTTLIALYAVTAVGRAQGLEEWGSLNGPAPVWPAVVGFGSMWTALFSFAVLIVLVAISVIRSATRRD